jgi:hypothetical protein
MPTTTATPDATLHVATATTGRRAAPAGWKKVEGLGFACTDTNRTRLQVYRRPVRAGERLSIPQDNWTGTLVLLPPGEKAKE